MERCWERPSLNFGPLAPASKFGQRLAPFEDVVNGDDRPDEAGNKQGRRRRRAVTRRRRRQQRSSMEGAGVGRVEVGVHRCCLRIFSVCCCVVLFFGFGCPSAVAVESMLIVDMVTGHLLIEIQMRGVATVFGGRIVGVHFLGNWL